MSDYYIGLMSGTSLDGIDAVLVSFDEQQVTQHASIYHELPTELRKEIAQTLNPQQSFTLKALGTLDQKLGKAFAEATLALLENTNILASQVKAIGSHGQTLWHQPQSPHSFSWQAGDANQIVEITGITTVADFRRRDMAAGGQGAPLVPAFHKALFSAPNEHRAILNIGGIANITTLPCDNTPILGFDTGPGNTLIDQWCFKYTGKNYDHNGQWAQQGTVISELLDKLLVDAYFKLPPPKSTGREHFNLGWLNQHLQAHNYQPVDIQATLTELTAVTISQAIEERAPQTQSIILCGGGAKNAWLCQRLQQHNKQRTLTTTLDLGIDPDWVEAIAFAWLAKQTMEGKAGNLPEVSGASGERILGAIYPA